MDSKPVRLAWLPFLFTVAGLGTAPGATSSPDTAPPNIVFIFSDVNAMQAISAY